MLSSRHKLRRIIQFSAIGAVLLFSGSQTHAVDGPSFDCSHGVRQTLAVILCTNADAARADWDVNRAYWALFTDDREETSFNETVNLRCAIPPLETQQDRAGRVFVQEFSRRILGLGLPISIPQPLTEQHVRCVIRAFHKRADELRSRLTGDALAESNLSPDEHIAIQAVLNRKGLLQNRVRSYGASIDGQFGPNTRIAIKDFQRSIDAPATGFLSSEQRIALVENPEEREARAARAAAQLKVKQDALEAKRKADELTKAAALEQEKKHLEDRQRGAMVTTIVRIRGRDVATCLN